MTAIKPEKKNTPLLFGYSGFLTIIVAISLVGLLLLNNANAAIDNALDSATAEWTAALEADSNLSAAYGAAKDVALADGQAEADGALETLTGLDSDIRSNFSDLAFLAPENELIARAAAAYDVWASHISGIAALTQGSQYEQAAALARSAVSGADKAALDESIGALVSYERSAVSAAYNAAEKAMVNSMLLLIAAAILALILSTAISLRSKKNLAEFMAEITQEIRNGAPEERSAVPADVSGDRRPGESDMPPGFDRRMIDAMPYPVYVVGRGGTIILRNRAFEAMAGVAGGDTGELRYEDIFDKSRANRHAQADAAAIELGKPARLEEKVRYPDGRHITLNTVKTPYLDSEGSALGLVCVGGDVTDLRKKAEEIQFLKQHDLLTGLLNRAAFKEAAGKLDKPKYLPLSAIMLDINGLKLINSGFGGECGDRVILTVADILKKSVRKGDLVFRTGGDEFCVFLPNAGAETAEKICREININCAERRNAKRNEMLYLSISVGASTKRSPDISLDSVIKNAESAMLGHKIFESKRMYSSLLASMKATLFERSHETEAHSERLVHMSQEIGKRMNMTREQLSELSLLASLHDIGKVAIKYNILEKTDSLNEYEFNEIKKHPEIGYRIASASPELLPIADYILYHHERWDGKGYPKGLSREQIPVHSRIIAVADAFDAMTGLRAYKKAMTREAALGEIERNAGTQFDPRIAKIFVDTMLEKSS